MRFDVFICCDRLGQGIVISHFLVSPIGYPHRDSAWGSGCDGAAWRERGVAEDAM